MMKMMTQMQQETHQFLLIIRNLEHLINTYKFEYIYHQASDFEKTLADNIIKSYDLHALKMWIKRNTITDLEDLSIQDLRKLASQLGILNYHSYSKVQLLNLIRKEL